MGDFIIVTDCTADLPHGVYKDLDVETVPMDFCIDGKFYKHYSDSRQMSYKDFYQKIREGRKITTAQVNTFEYESIFESFLRAGENVLYLCFSSGLSGTYHVASLVANDLQKKYPEKRVVVIDTLCASIGEGLLVYYAAIMRKEGKSLDEVIDWVEKNKLNVSHWFVVDDLEHLKQGGRITSLQANLGTVLNLKPIISLNIQGKLDPVSRQRGSKRALEELVNCLKRYGDNIQNQTVIVGHADNLEFAEKLSDLLMPLVEKVVVSEIGPVIGTHVGSGMFALAFLGCRY